MRIESPHNERVKLVRSLHSPKGRQEAGLFLAEGTRVVAEALMYAPGIEWLAWCPELSGEEAEELVDAAEQAGIAVVELGQRAFEALSDTRSPQGIAAVLRCEAFPLTALEVPQGACRVLVLHSVRDPGNLGTMIRTADAFGAEAVILTGTCADPYEPKAVRATAGSLFHLPIVEAEWGQVTAWASASEVTLVAADPEAEPELGATLLPKRIGVVIGNEAWGLPEEVLRDAGMTIRIPMPGRAASLNAASAAAVVLYEAFRSAAMPPEQGRRQRTTQGGNHPPEQQSRRRKVGGEAGPKRGGVVG